MYINSNNVPYMNKTLNREIMKRSNLSSKFLNSINEEDRQRFVKQGIVYVFLLRKTKRIKHKLFKITPKNVIDNRKFWKKVKPVLSNKFTNGEKISLVDNNKIITNGKDIAKVLNDYSNRIKKLNISQKKTILSQ